MLKKFFIGALIVLSSFAMISVSEAHHGNGHYHHHGNGHYQGENYCCDDYR